MNRRNLEVIGWDTRVAAEQLVEQHGSRFWAAYQASQNARACDGCDAMETFWLDVADEIANGKFDALEGAAEEEAA